MTETSIRPLEVGDISEIARVHRSAFPGSALTLLGDDAVRRYYDWQLTGPHSVIALGAFDEMAMKSFCIGGTFRGSMSGFLRKEWHHLFLCALRHPSVLLDERVKERARMATRILRRKPANDPSLSVPTPIGSLAVLSLATHETYRRQGLASELLGAFEREVLRAGYTKMHLSVDPENVEAIHFYERSGWKRVPGSKLMVKTILGTG